MLIPDFTRYSLALFDGDRLIHSDAGAGLRPLWDALEKYRGQSGLILHDKVIGLAAARLVVYSGIVGNIVTMVASLPAREFLEKSGIPLTAFDYTANILMKDKSAVCPGELIALSTDDIQVFLEKIRTMFEQAGRPLVPLNG